jgi:sporadic carbohydrate cluster protein (TIGR04323 family)
MKKKFAGYINLKNLNGVLYPSSMQNIMMKDYVQNVLKGTFYLSPTEVLQAKYPITLRTLLGKETKIDGIVMLSSFYLPKEYKIREQIYSESIKTKKKLYFILDEMIFKNKLDKAKIEEFLFFKNNFFTETRTKLNKNEETFMKKFKKISFV